MPDANDPPATGDTRGDLNVKQSMDEYTVEITFSFVGGRHLTFAQRKHGSRRNVKKRIICQDKTGLMALRALILSNSCSRNIKEVDLITQMMYLSLQKVKKLRSAWICPLLRVCT